MAFLVNKQARGRARATDVPNFKRQIFWGIFRLVLIVLVGVLMWHVTRLPFFTITEVQISGGETISHDDARALLFNELQGAYFHIIPKHFSYLYPHDRMIDVLKKNPRMHNIVVERTNRTTIAVSFDEYIPYALWCTDASEVPLCYFLTADGYAFAEAPALVGGTLVRHTVEGLGEIDEGAVIDASVLKNIDAFIARAESELGFRITSLRHTKDGDVQLFVNGGGMITIAKGKDFTETFENVKSVMASKDFSHIEPGNFNYIDARFSNKIFVNEEMTPPELMSTTTQEATTTLPE